MARVARIGNNTSLPNCALRDADQPVRGLGKLALSLKGISMVKAKVLNYSPNQFAAMVKLALPAGVLG